MAGAATVGEAMAEAAVATEAGWQWLRGLGWREDPAPHRRVFWFHDKLQDGFLLESPDGWSLVYASQSVNDSHINPYPTAQAALADLPGRVRKELEHQQKTLQAELEWALSLCPAPVTP